MKSWGDFVSGLAIGSCGAALGFGIEFCSRPVAYGDFVVLVLVVAVNVAVRVIPDHWGSGQEEEAAAVSSKEEQ